MPHRYRSLLSAVEELCVRSAEHHSAVPDITVDSDLGPSQKPLDDNIVLCCLPAGILICIFQLRFTVDDRYAPASGAVHALDNDRISDLLRNLFHLLCSESTAAGRA